VQSYALPLPAKAQAYVEQLLAVPAMQDWYRDAMAEPWRVPHYEELARASGEWLADERVAAS
jgi:glutathione S-transferase